MKQARRIVLGWRTERRDVSFYVLFLDALFILIRTERTGALIVQIAVVISHPSTLALIAIGDQCLAMGKSGTPNLV